MEETGYSAIAAHVYVLYVAESTAKAYSHVFRLSRDDRAQAEALLWKAVGEERKQLPWFLWQLPISIVVSEREKKSAAFRTAFDLFLTHQGIPLGPRNRVVASTWTLVADCVEQISSEGWFKQNAWSTETLQ